MILQNRRILLGVSASIAAYKAAELCSLFGKLGADVHVVLTKNAERFVGAPTFRALTRNPVLIDLFEEPHNDRIAHIDIAQSADLVLVAPASADIIAKAAHGIADDFLTTCLLATPNETSLLFAPAMNTVMWEHEATQTNVQTLSGRGVQFIEPATGLLACQDIGPGKLADVNNIVAAVVSRLTTRRDLDGTKVLITAGATREPLDPVRFISNRSSGKMGFALASAALDRGAVVTIVCGFTTASPPRLARLLRVESATEMLDVATHEAAEADIVIAAAAVADYAPENVSASKIKKSASNGVRTSGDDGLVIRFKRNPDVVRSIGASKTDRQFVVGFAAETEDLAANAKAKLEAKHLDLVVANDITLKGAGFDSDTNIASLHWPDGRHEQIPMLTKRELAHLIFDRIAAHRTVEATSGSGRHD